MTPRAFAYLLPIASLLSFTHAFALGSDQEPGQKIHVDMKALRPPYSPPSGANGPRTIPKPDAATLRVPRGFAVDVFADDLENARNVRVAPNGDVFVVQSKLGRIVVMNDNGGKAGTIKTFAEGFHYPHGFAFTSNAVLVGDLDGVWKIPYAAGDMRARARQVRVTPEGALGDPGGHATRNVAVSPDGSRFYVAVGSRGNIAEEPEPRATIQEFAMDGSRQRTFARGLRNAVGIAFYPGSNDLYAVVNERDTLGDELVPDYLTKVIDGGFYGWPYSYLGQNPQPKFADIRPDLVARAITPDFAFRSHSAPVGMVFYTAAQFPQEYRGGAFVALRGSWNTSRPRGYTVVHVPFGGGKPATAYTVFASGFWAGGEKRADVWGRPSGVAVAKDGSLLIADDVSGTVWRVSYKGK
jgi:glucose/arabinose dehydrogenase